jgi:serine/threonine-protein kinase
MPATNELLQEGRYRIHQPVSGDANVFEAYDTVRNTNVLVREFPVRLNKVTTVSQQESIRLAFANQAKALAEIEHETLLHVQDYFSEIDRQYLVMDPIEGEDVIELIRDNRKPFSLQTVLAWADQLLDALTYLHTRKPSIVHRNVRPQNLRRDPAGRIKLLGVGLDGGPDNEFAGPAPADASELRYSPMERIWPGLDAASQKVITNSYDDRSERILKEPLDARSDIYSLGATLYFLITGIEPFDPLERAIDLLEGKLDPLREPTKVDPQIPAEISDVLMKALEIKREMRYDSALIMREGVRMAIARVEDREAEERREQEEAAEIIRLAAQAKNAPPAIAKADAERAAADKHAEFEQRQLREAEERRAAAEQEAAEAEKRRRDDEMQQQLREAEQQRMLVEERAAQAALLQQHEEGSATPNDPVREENLLEIPANAGAEVIAYRDNPAVDEAELAAVLEELEKAELESHEPQRVEGESGPPESAVSSDALPNFMTEPAAGADTAGESDDIQVLDAPIDMPSPQESASYSEQSDEMFAEAGNPRRSLPIPAIAGAIGLVAVIAVGGWFALSSSPAPDNLPQQTEVQVAQPVEPDPVRPEDLIDTTQNEPGSDALIASDPTQQPATEAKAPIAKPKKAEPAKPEAEKKKAVTVDDLINDN